ncbi:MAG TPA: T9SS type A sorting domain-containing protein [Bacteroidia bacterium]|jgi:dienelactone hydrolase
MKDLQCILVIIVSSLSGAFSQPYPVGHVQITFTDPVRGGRAIQTELYYPAQMAGTATSPAMDSFPLIVFGHGFVMSWDAYQNFWNEFVPKGYVIAFPRTEGNFSPNHNEFGKDLSFLADKIRSEGSNNSSFILYSHVSSRAAIVGHSMGGGSAFLAAAGNSAVSTMISFAAANTNPSAVSAASAISVPVLVFSAENDCVAPPAQHQVLMYDSLGSTCKSFINITGGGHCEFAEYNFNCSFGQSTCTPQPAISGAGQKDVVYDFLDPWLKYYLKNDCSSMGIFMDSLTTSDRITYLSACASHQDPVIIQSGAVLQSTVAQTYQWFFNGTMLPGENSQTLSTVPPGLYYVEVTYTDLCIYRSDTIVVAATGLNSSDIKAELDFFPNPPENFISVVIQKGFGSLEIRNVAGQVLLQKRRVADRERVDLSGLCAGIYFVVLKSDLNSVTRKLVKK